MRPQVRTPAPPPTPDEYRRALPWTLRAAILYAPEALEAPRGRRGR